MDLKNGLKSVVLTGQMALVECQTKCLGRFMANDRRSQHNKCTPKDRSDHERKPPVPDE